MDLRSISDTSYFKPGNDDWNMVESVLREEPSSVLLLLNRGADPNAQAESGMTALMYAAEMGDTTMIKLLVLNGAETELAPVENTSPLIAAVLNQQFDAAHVLLKNGANPDRRDNYGGSPLIYSAALNDYRIADLVMFFGGSDSIRDRDGNDALMTSVFFGHLETSDVLLQNGLSPDSRDNLMRTPLMVAAQQGDTAMMRLLLEYGAGKELTDGKNYTPLAHAIRSDRKEAVRILADSGANVHHRLDGKMNLYDLASRHGHREIQKILREKGASASLYPGYPVVGVAWGNSFGRETHMMQARIWLQESKFGFFAESGYDVRPTLRPVQKEINDTLVHQYRESRSVWTHGAGKYFTLLRDAQGMEYGLYAGLYGMLSFPSYRGIEDRPPVEYDLSLAAGLFMQGKMAGIKAGADRYSYGSLLESNWKINVTLYLRIPVNKGSYEEKEIIYNPQ
jgi:ankyrin repeat protein